MVDSSTKVVTGVVRLSFVRLLEPQADEQGKLKYSCTILVPKSDTDTINKIRAAQKKALANGKQKPFGGTIPKNWKDTFHDGDEDGDLEKYPELAGHYYMSVSALERFQPQVVDAALKPIDDPREVYSGMYARVSISAFPFSNSGNKGVSFGLNNVMKVRDGERLAGGGSSAESDFAEFVGLDNDEWENDEIDLDLD